MVTGGLRRILQLEGLVYFVAGVIAYIQIGGSLLLFVILFLVPDLAFVAYLSGPRAGAWAYNTMHSSVGPLILGALGWWSHDQLALQIAIIWLSHVGFDRMLGYGLKYESGFKDTHLGKL